MSHFNVFLSPLNIMDDEHTQASDTSIDDLPPNNPVTHQEGNVVERDVENCAVEGSDPAVSNEDSDGPVRRPKTEEEMRECKYCEFKAGDWPVSMITCRFFHVLFSID